MDQSQADLRKLKIIRATGIFGVISKIPPRNLRGGEGEFFNPTAGFLYI
jgi:hypothetical protein